MIIGLILFFLIEKDTLRGGIKNACFTFSQKGGEGVSANPKNPYQKILRFFLTISDQKLSFF